MKTLRILNRFAAATCLLASFTLTLSSCSDDDDDEPGYVQPATDDDDIVLDVASAGFQYGENGAWASVYDTSVGNFNVQGFSFTHEASSSEWGGYVYYSWKGFSPSVSSDNADHSADSWTDYQWGAITGGGIAGTGTPYVLGMWDVNEALDAVPQSPACAVTYNAGAVFDPEEVYVTNSAWGYYGVKNGSAFNKAFTESDWCKLYIKGVRNGVVTGTVEVYLANGTQILNAWKRVDLDPLGDAVDMIYFQMSSSDTGQWGMNNPAFFCIDRLAIDID